MKTSRAAKAERKSVWEFCLALSGTSDCSNELGNALFEAGCDDATLSKSHGRLWLDFAREADSLAHAILTAIADVRKAGRSLRIPLDAESVDYCSLVTQAEIARRLSRSRQCIGQYVVGSRGTGDFPAAAFHLQEGMPLWDWRAVVGWFVDRGLAEQRLAWDASVIETINDALRSKASGLRSRPALDRDFMEVIAKSLFQDPASRREWAALHKRRSKQEAVAVRQKVADRSIGGCITRHKTHRDAIKKEAIS